MHRNESSATHSLPDAHGKRVAVVVAEFYPEIAGMLIDGAQRAALAAGILAEDIVQVTVPGCFEVPVALQRLLRREEEIYAAVALGAVVRGETPHFDYVAGEASRGIMSLQLTSGVPIGFGILTTESLEQARVRADAAQGDAGYTAMIAALRVAGIDTEPERATIGFRRG